MGKSTFNHSRRQTLKAIGIAGGTVALPAWALSAHAAPLQNPPAEASSIVNGLSISFSDSYHAGAQLISVSNNSSEALTLRPIYPGIVYTAGKAYDLNDLLENGELTIAAGKTQVYRITSVDINRPEQITPQSLANGHAVEVLTIERSFNKAHAVSTTRYSVA